MQPISTSCKSTMDHLTRGQEVIPGEHQVLAKDPHANKSTRQTDCLKIQTHQNDYIRQAQIPDCSTTTWTTPCQHALLLLARQKLLHRTWRVLSFTVATTFIHLHQMSCTAPSSAKDLVGFDDESLSFFCFSCPTPHEAGKGPAVCFWHNHTSNWYSILLYNHCTWAYREGHSLCW